TRSKRDWSSDVCSSDLVDGPANLHRIVQTYLYFIPLSPVCFNNDRSVLSITPVEGGGIGTFHHIHGRDVIGTYFIKTSPDRDPVNNIQRFIASADRAVAAQHNPGIRAHSGSAFIYRQTRNLALQGIHDVQLPCFCQRFGLHALRTIVQRPCFPLYAKSSNDNVIALYCLGLEYYFEICTSLYWNLPGLKTNKRYDQRVFQRWYLQAKTSIGGRRGADLVISLYHYIDPRQGCFICLIQHCPRYHLSIKVRIWSKEKIQQYNRKEC